MAEQKQPEIEKEFIIPLRSGWKRVPRYKRANKAIKTIKEFLVRHMKIRDRDLNKIRIDKRLNELVWLRGIKKPPIKVKVKVKKEKEIIRVESFELPNRIKFKQAREDKIEKQAKEAIEKKKTLLEKAKSTKETKKETPEEKTEEKKEEEEKKSAVIEANKQIEKTAAKTAKHQASAKSKEPKRQQRKALAK